MKIKQQTMQRIFADMRAIVASLPENKQELVRQAMDGKVNGKMSIAWELYHLAFAERNYDDSHPRYQVRPRVLALAEYGTWPMYPDGANDDHLATMLNKFTL